MSLTDRKNKVLAQAGTATQTMQDARDWAAPRVGQGVSTAREWAAPRAGQAAEGARSARDWAAPRVGQGVRTAREWAAPRIGQAANTVQESIAPKVSEMLSATAQRVDPATAPSAGTARRRLLPRLLTVLAMLIGAGVAVAAVSRWRRARLVDDMTTYAEMEEPAAQPEEPQDSDRPLAEAELGGNGQRPAS